jgi:hypothetical protein
MTVWLGPLTNMQALPYVGRDVECSPVQAGAVHQLAGGGRRRHRAGQPRRNWSMSRNQLTVDEVAVWEGLFWGSYGDRPYRLIEQWRRNMLPPNVSSGTDVLRDTTGFVMVSGTSVASGTTQVERGTRSLEWVVTATGQQLRLSAGATTSGDADADIPVIPGQFYVGWLRARATVAVLVNLAAIFYPDDGLGAQTTGTGANVTLSTTVWQTVQVTVQAPVGAHLMRLRLNTAGAGAGTIYVNAAQVEAGQAINSWTLGSGVPKVAIDTLGESWQTAYGANSTVTLVEL